MRCSTRPEPTSTVQTSSRINRPSLLILMGLFMAVVLAMGIPARADEGQMDHASQGSSETADSSGDQSAASLIAPGSNLYRAIKYVGKFHLMVLHFPIAFLLAAALVQWWRLFTGNGDQTVSLLIWFGAIGAIVAATFGWMYAYDSVYFGDDEKLLFWHRWLGTATAILAVTILFLHKKMSTRVLATSLNLCALAVTAAAHFGASLVYGADFLKKF